MRLSHWLEGWHGTRATNRLLTVAVVAVATVTIVQSAYLMERERTVVLVPPALQSEAVIGKAQANAPYHTAWAQAFTTGISLTDKLGMYLESFGIFPSGAKAPDAGPEYYADGGFTYRITNNFQLDIRAGVGLNRHADDFFAGSGFAVRY